MPDVQLPFLLVHGAWIWRVPQAVIAIVCVALFVVARRWWTRRNAHADIAWQRRSITAVASGPVTLVGHLRGGSLTTIVQSYRQSATRDGTPWCDVGGVRLELASEVHVEAGSAVSALRRHFGATLIRTLSEGDQIVVSGELRDDDGARRLVGRNHGAISAHAIVPRVAALPLGPIRFAFLAALSYGIAHLVLLEAGSIELERGRREPLATHLSSTDSIVLASALPGSRDDAIEHLDNALDVMTEHDNLELPLASAIDELTGRCPHLRLEIAGEIDEAIEAAKRCATRYDVAQLLVYAGRFEEASVWSWRWPRNTPEYLTIAVAQGRWLDAAAGIDENAQAESRSTLQAIRDHALADRCAAAMLKTFAGEHGAFAKITERDASPACVFDEAMTLPDNQRRDALVGLGLRDANLPLDSTSIAALAAPAEAPWDAESFYGWRANKTMWFASATPYDHFIPWRAALDVARESFVDAHNELALADTKASVGEFDETAKLLEGRPIVAPLDVDHVFEREQLSLGHPIADSEYWQRNSPDCQLREGLNAAVAGDGSLLASAIMHCDLRTENRMWLDVIAVLPHVTSHRDDVAASLRRARRILLSDSVFGLADQAARLRDLSRLVGDAREAARWRAVFARLDSVLSNRQKLLAYLALQN